MAEQPKPNNVSSDFMWLVAFAFGGVLLFIIDQTVFPIFMWLGIAMGLGVILFIGYVSPGGRKFFIGLSSFLVGGSIAVKTADWINGYLIPSIQLFIDEWLTTQVPMAWENNIFPLLVVLTLFMVIPVTRNWVLQKDEEWSILLAAVLFSILKVTWFLGAFGLVATMIVVGHLLKEKAPQISAWVVKVSKKKQLMYWMIGAALVPLWLILNVGSSLVTAILQGSAYQTIAVSLGAACAKVAYDLYQRLAN